MCGMLHSLYSRIPSLLCVVLFVCVYVWYACMFPCMSMSMHVHGEQSLVSSLTALHFTYLKCLVEAGAAQHRLA